MARRRRRRVRHAAAAPRRRRRRRSIVRYAANPVRRRRTRRYRANSHRRARRHYRRNPGLAGGIVSTIKQGAVDGAMVLAGQTVVGRLSDLVQSKLPIQGIAGSGIANVGSAVAVALIAKKAIPGQARMITAGAFAAAIKRIVTGVAPGVGGLLGDTGYDTAVGYPGVHSYGAWASPPVVIAPAPHSRMGAYPGGGLGDDANQGAMMYS